MEDSSSTDTSHEVKDCLFLISGHRSFHDYLQVYLKSFQNCSSRTRHLPVSGYPGCTTSNPLRHGGFSPKGKPANERKESSVLSLIKVSGV